MGHLEQVAGETDQIFEPERLEPQLRAELPQLGRDLIVEKIVAGDDGHGRVALFVVRPQPAQEAQAVDQRHPKIQDDRVRMALSASRRPVSAVIAVRTSYPSSRSIRANVWVTPSSSSTIRIVATSRSVIRVDT